MKKWLVAMMTVSAFALAAAPAIAQEQHDEDGQKLDALCGIWRQDSQTCGCVQQTMMGQYGFTAEELWRFSQSTYMPGTIAEKNRRARFGLSIREIGMSCHENRGA